tara:strand:- start:192 stop:554 length:363 start_codon:yes stop_codon:yes gene_type:complete
VGRMKKIILITLIAFFSFEAKTDEIKDIELSAELLAFAEYGSKSSWSESDVIRVERMVSEFSDPDLKEIWISNVITYALIGNLPKYPSNAMCKIAKRNISKLRDKELKSIWDLNYGLYGC